MRYSVTLERGVDGGYMAWVHELWGCFARAPTRREVEAKIGPAIEEFREWLGVGAQEPPTGDAPREEAGTPGGPMDFAIVAEVDTPTRAADADSEALLEPDQAPLTREDWARQEGWLHLSRADLERLWGQFDRESLNWQPEGARRSARGHLVHIGMVELMYAAWTFDLRSPAGIAGFLQWTRRVAAERMRELAGVDRATVTQAEWGPRLEPWTPRKAARRLLWHERLHTRAIARLLGRRATIEPTAALRG